MSEVVCKWRVWVQLDTRSHRELTASVVHACTVTSLELDLLACIYIHTAVDLELNSSTVGLPASQLRKPGNEATLDAARYPQVDLPTYFLCYHLHVIS